MVCGGSCELENITEFFHFFVNLSVENFSNFKIQPHTRLEGIQ